MYILSKCCRASIIGGIESCCFKVEFYEDGIDVTEKVTDIMDKPKTTKGRESTFSRAGADIMNMGSKQSSRESQRTSSPLSTSGVDALDDLVSRSGNVTPKPPLKKRIQPLGGFKIPEKDSLDEFVKPNPQSTVKGMGK